MDGAAPSSLIISGVLFFTAIGVGVGIEPTQ